MKLARVLLAFPLAHANIRGQSNEDQVQDQGMGNGGVKVEASATAFRKLAKVESGDASDPTDTGSSAKAASSGKKASTKADSSSDKAESSGKEEASTKADSKIGNIRDLLPAHAIPDLSSRNLQDVSTLESSPPTDYALSLTPKGYRSNLVIDAGINLSNLGLCDKPENTEACQLIFPPSKEFLEHSKVGVVFYGGALVDTRGYAPIAHQLSNRYGLPVVIPFFENNLAFEFGSCDTKKVELASRAFPQVQKWVLAGHSYGGTAAMSDLFTIVNKNGTETTAEHEATLDDIAGLVLIGSYVSQAVACGMVDFSDMDIPTANIYGELDLIVNQTNWEEGRALLPQNHTLSLPIFGGNHGQFGSYDDSGRFWQTDGIAAVPETLQHDMTVTGIMSVASRAGVRLPVKSEKKKKSMGKKSKKSKK